MELIVHDHTHLVEIWLTNEEKNDPEIQAWLKKCYAEYKMQKYLVAVFHSGMGDLYQGTRELLSYNKRRSAEAAVQNVKSPQRAAGMDR